MEELCAGLGVDPKMGLTEEQVRERLIAEGGNVFSQGPRISFPYRLLLLLQQNLLVFLQLLHLLSLIRPLNSEGGVSKLLHILLILFYLAPLMYRSYVRKKEEIIAGMEVMDTVRCMRKGVVVFVDTAHLVKGDIVFLATDNVVPADAKVLKTESLYVDRGNLTGEKMVFRAKTGDLIRRGEKIICGIANAVVVATGDHTEEGQLRLQNQYMDSTLQIPSLSEAFLTVLTALIVCLGVLIAQYDLDFPAYKHLIVISLIIARFYEDYYTCQIVVSSITQRQIEGLGLSIQNYPSPDIVSNLSRICVNLDDFVMKKKKQVSRVYVNGGVKTVKEMKLGEGVELAECCVLGNAAVFEVNPAVKEKRVIGSQEEGALLMFAESIVDIPSLQSYQKTYQHYEKDNYHLYIRTQIHPDSTYSHKLVCVGNPDYILRYVQWENIGKNRCSVERNRLEEVILKMKEAGYGVIMTAYRDLKTEFPVDFVFNRENLPLGNWTLGGILALNDELLQSFGTALSAFRENGIPVTAFTTGSYQDTVSYLRQLGVIEGEVKSDTVLNTEEMTVVNGEKVPIAGILTVVEKEAVVVVCHLRMNDRYDLVKEMQERDGEVGYVSGALNDIPPMRGAGFSVAISTEDVLLQNCNFSLSFPDPQPIISMKSISSTEPHRRTSTLHHLWGLFFTQLGIFPLAFCIPRFEAAQWIALFMEVGALNAPCYTFGPIARKWGVEAGVLSLFAGYFAFFFVLADFGIPLSGLWTSDLTTFSSAGSGPFTPCIYESTSNCYHDSAFLHAQTAFFISVAASQWTLYLLMQLEDYFRGRSSLHWGTIHMTYFFKLVFLMLLATIPKLREIVKLTPLHFEHFGFPGVTLVVCVYGGHLLLNKVISILRDK